MLLSLGEGFEEIVRYEASMGNIAAIATSQNPVD
jgi:hypothetical protein